MTDPNLPPPPPSFPSQPHASGEPAYGSPPPGYVAYGEAAAVLPQPRGLRIATLIGFAGVTVFCAVLGAVAYDRGNLAEKFFTTGGVTINELEHSDNRVQALAWMLIALQVVAAIVLAVWTHRTTSNARTRYPYSDVKPGLAAGGWFIPIGNLFVPWIQLRRAAEEPTGRASTAINLWQAAFVLQFLGGRFASGLGEFDSGSSAQEVIDELHQQGIVYFVTAALLGLAAIAAFKAMPRIDAATAGES